MKKKTEEEEEEIYIQMFVMASLNKNASFTRTVCSVKPTTVHPTTDNVYTTEGLLCTVEQHDYYARLSNAG